MKHTDKTLNPIQSLKGLPHFIETTLNPEGYTGPSKKGFMNLNNGCFACPIIRATSVPQHTAEYTGEVELIWHVGSHASIGHIVVIEGDEINQFLTLEKGRKI